MNNTSFAYLHT